MSNFKRARQVIDSISDEMLAKPASRLTSQEKDLLQEALTGPYSSEIMDRIHKLNLER